MMDADLSGSITDGRGRAVACDVLPCKNTHIVPLRCGAMRCRAAQLCPVTLSSGRGAMRSRLPCPGESAVRVPPRCRVVRGPAVWCQCGVVRLCGAVRRPCRCRVCGAPGVCCAPVGCGRYSDRGGGHLCSAALGGAACGAVLSCAASAVPCGPSGAVQCSVCCAVVCAARRSARCCLSHRCRVW